MRFLNLLYLSIGKSDRTLNFFRQNIMVIGLYMALVQKIKKCPFKYAIPCINSSSGGNSSIFDPNMLSIFFFLFSTALSSLHCIRSLLAAMLSDEQEISKTSIIWEPISSMSSLIIFFLFCACFSAVQEQFLLS